MLTQTQTQTQTYNTRVIDINREESFLGRGDSGGVNLRYLYFCDLDNIVSDWIFGRISKVLISVTAICDSSNSISFDWYPSVSR